MKKLLMIGIAVVIFSSIVNAGTPAAKIDTLTKSRVTGLLDRFVAGWKFTATTTADTLIAPLPGHFAQVINHGALGDTVKISWAQIGFAAQFSMATIGGHDAQVLDFAENLLKRIIIKATGTAAVEVIIMR